MLSSYGKKGKSREEIEGIFYGAENAGTIKGVHEKK
jgi:hypothetical protein